MYEAEMKARILNHLLIKGMIRRGDTILNEFTFNATSRRIDLAYIRNDSFIGIEVKSEYDSLARLNGQLSEYATYFDKVIVFTSQKHELSASRLLVGKETLLIQDSKGRIRQKKRGVTQRSSAKSIYIQMMRASDLATICSKNNLKIKKRNRASLESLAYSIPTRNLREHCLSSLKKRYSEKSEAFWRSTDSNIKPEDIQILSRGHYQKENKVSISSLLKSGRI
jgi:hypothetical protein